MWSPICVLGKRGGVGVRVELHGALSTSGSCERCVFSREGYIFGYEVFFFQNVFTSGFWRGKIVCLLIVKALKVGRKK